MKTKEERMPKLVIKPEFINTSWGYGLEDNVNLMICPFCLSPLHYIKINWGVVAENGFIQVMHNRSERCYQLREIGLSVYCAECGEFIECYSKWFYPEDRMITNFYDLDELGMDERAEIQNCLSQFNQKGDFVSRYKSNVFDNLKEELKKYEKKHPIKNSKKINLRRRNK